MQLYASPMAANLELSLVTHYSMHGEHVEYPYQKDLVFGFCEIDAEKKKILNITEDNHVLSYSTFTLPVSAWQMEQFKANGGI